jgi:CDP-archaeol synthase
MDSRYPLSHSSRDSSSISVKMSANLYAQVPTRMTSFAAALPNWLKALVLLGAAHTAPWAAGYLLAHRLGAPIDAGMTLTDGRRLLGDHKTWRGLLAAILACALASTLLGYSVTLGIAFAALALAGDAASSLIKRRLRLEPGAECPGLDQIPEALTPLLALSAPLGINAGTACVLAGVFMLADIAAMPLRRHPPPDDVSKRPSGSGG